MAGQNGWNGNGRGRKLPRVLSDEEGRRLIEQIPLSHPTGRRNRAMIELMLYSGLRVSEVCDLKRKHVDWTNRQVLVENGKRGKDRMVPMRPKTVECLRAWDGDRHGHAGQFFHTIKGGRHSRVSRSSALKAVQRYAGQAGLEDVHCHTLRHTCATMLRRRGVDLETIQDILGHANIQTTRIYRHVAGVEMAEAVDLLDDQPTLEGQPDRLDRVLMRALRELPVEVKQRLAEALAGESG